MARIKDVEVGVTRLINLGNYENVTYHCKIGMSLEPGDNPDTAYDIALNYAKAKVGIEVDRLLPLVKKK